MSGREPLFHKTTVQNDLDELRKQSRADAVEEHMPEHQQVAFEAVTRSMRAALSETPELVLDDVLSDEQRWALTQIFIAHTGRDPLTTRHLSGLDRSGRFNRALAILQPVLAAALRPDFAGGRPVYAALTGQVAALRKAITRSIIAETMPKKKTEAKAVDESDDDERPEGDEVDEPDEGGGDGADGGPRLMS